MSFGATLKMLLAAFLILGASQPCWGGQMWPGVTGGTIRGFVAGADRSRVPCVVAVPDSIVVLDVKFCYDRIIVATWVESEDPVSREANYLSEVWMFAAREAGNAPIAFEDRKVLLSRESVYGESMTTYAYSINCSDATAVYDAGWEWSNVRLFDKAGAALPDINAAVADACNCNPEYTVPVAWLEIDRRCSLILSVSDGGRGPYFVRFDPATGAAEGLSPDQIDVGLFSQVANAVAAQRGHGQ